MRTLVSLLALVSLLGGSAQAQKGRQATPELEGVWRGALGPLHLVLTISRTADGSLRGLLDSVDQGAKLPIDVLAFTEGKLHFEIAGIGGVYDATLDAGRLRGGWVQRGVPVQQLDFDRVPEGSATAPPVAGPPPGMPPPLEVVVPRAPTPVLARGRATLVYELHVTNFGSREAVLLAVDAQDDRGTSLWRSSGLDLSTRLERVGWKDEVGEAQRRLPAGARAIVFVWITLSGPSAPARLTHRVEVRGPDGGVHAVVCPAIELTGTALRLGPPLKGHDWKALNGPDDVSPHRRAVVPVAGRAGIAQRFAIDWVRVRADGATFAGDARKNASYLAWGQEAIAVADGTISAVKDGIGENVPGDRLPPPTLETIAGNHVLLDLGGGRRALYAHLQPGSLRVKVGDKVKRGQVLGLVGNSGNSTEPHLHFHVAEGATPLGAEGVPYVFDAYEVRRTPKAQKERRPGELVLRDELIDF